MEPVEVDDAASLLRGEVEEHEALSAEVGHVVVHLESVADSLPVLTVEAVEERCFVGAIAEVVVNTEPDLRLIERLGLDVLPVGIIAAHGSVHYDGKLSVLLLHAHETIATLEGCQSCPVAVFHLRDIYQCLS